MKTPFNFAKFKQKIKNKTPALIFIPTIAFLFLFYQNCLGTKKASVSGRSESSNEHYNPIQQEENEEPTPDDSPAEEQNSDEGIDDPNLPPGPDEAPTAEPTTVPTSEPTADPNAQPTSDPNAQPTSAPTAEPTALPTGPILFINGQAGKKINSSYRTYFITLVNESDLVESTKDYYPGMGFWGALNTIIPNNNAPLWAGSNIKSQTNTQANLEKSVNIFSNEDYFAIVDTSNNKVFIKNGHPKVKADLTFDIILGSTSYTAMSYGDCLKNKLFLPTDIQIVGEKFYVLDSNNNRILVWDSIPSNGEEPHHVIGQDTFTNCAKRTDNRGFSSPRSFWTDGTRFVVSDTGNNRLLIWNSYPINGTTYNDADIIITGLNYPLGVDSNKYSLAVVDSSNHRVLVWKNFPTTPNQPADFVLGQKNLTTTSFGATLDKLYYPSDVFFYKEDLIISDTYNNRTLIYDGQYE